MKSIDIHERLEVRCVTNNLVNRPARPCKMDSVREEVLVAHNHNNVLVHMAEFVVWIAEYNPQSVAHCGLYRR